MGLGELARIESSEIKLSNPFISQSITPQVFPRGSFLDPNFPLQSFEGEKVPKRPIFKSLWKSNFSLTSTFPSQWFIVSILQPWLRMRNARTDKLLRHNVMLYNVVLADKWLLWRRGWSNIIFTLPGMYVYAKWQRHQIWMTPCSLSGGSTNLIILIRLDRSCVSIGACFD